MTSRFVLRSTLLPASLLALLMQPAVALAQGGTPADVLDSISGTYAMTYSDFGNTDGPFPNKTAKTIVINGVANTLCIDGRTLSNPVKSFDSQQFLFQDSTLGVFIGSGINSASISALNVSKGTSAATALTFKGQLSGKRTSTDTDCSVTGGSTTTAPPTISADVQSIFDLAAEIFPSQFKDGTAFGTYEGYVYKFFPASKIYVGVKENAVYLMGGPYGSTPSNKGAVGLVLSSLQTAKANIAKQLAGTGANGGGNVAVNLYTLRITGNIGVSGLAGITLPGLDLTLQNMPAPAVSDTAVIIDQVKTQLGTATGIANIKVTSINNTASRVTFRVEFTATLNGMSVTYDLTYDYTR